MRYQRTVRVVQVNQNLRTLRHHLQMNQNQPQRVFEKEGSVGFVKHFEFVEYGASYTVKNEKQMTLEFM